MKPLQYKKHKILLSIHCYSEHVVGMGARKALVKTIFNKLCLLRFGFLCVLYKQNGLCANKIILCPFAIMHLIRSKVNCVEKPTYLTHSSNAEKIYYFSCKIGLICMTHAFITANRFILKQKHKTYVKEFQSQLSMQFKKWKVIKGNYNRG